MIKPPQRCAAFGNQRPRQGNGRCFQRALPAACGSGVGGYNSSTKQVVRHNRTVRRILERDTMLAVLEDRPARRRSEMMVPQRGSQLRRNGLLTIFAGG